MYIILGSMSGGSLNWRFGRWEQDFEDRFGKIEVAGSGAAVGATAGGLGTLAGRFPSASGAESQAAVVTGDATRERTADRLQV